MASCLWAVCRGGINPARGRLRQPQTPRAAFRPPLQSKANARPSRAQIHAAHFPERTCPFPTVSSWLCTWPPRTRVLAGHYPHPTSLALGHLLPRGKALNCRNDQTKNRLAGQSTPAKCSRSIFHKRTAQKNVAAERAKKRQLSIVNAKIL